jgi:NAD+-dependent secondary alcohol dehydrogenase Adh1
MRAAVLREYGRPLEFEERPIPEPTAPDQVVVKIGAAGVCATDLHSIDGLMEPAGVSLPRVLGHENAGWVHAVADHVSTVRRGDSVIVYPAISCGLCLPCRRGTDMHCERREFVGLSLDGGFAEYVLVTERSLIKLPPGLDPSAVAPHADAGVTAYHAVKRLASLSLPGTTAVVIGIGGVGHIALQLIRELGSGVVIAVDTHEDRRRLARELGADEVLGGDGSVVSSVRELTNGRGADLVFDFAGTDQTHADALNMLAHGGTFSIVGYQGLVSTPSAPLAIGEQTIAGNLVGSWPDLWELLQLHATGRLTLRTTTSPMGDINEVLARLRAGETTGRAVLVLPDPR